MLSQIYKKTHLLIALCLTALLLSACNGTFKSTRRGAPALWLQNTVVQADRQQITPTSAVYRVDANDRLRIRVFGEAALSGQYLVDAAGTISMPLISTVHVRGRTTREIQVEITRKLRAGFLRNPSVAVEMLTFRPFYILGEVQRAGKYPYVTGMNVQTAIATAGGYSARAHKRKVVVTRHTANGTRRFKLGRTDAIFPGDTIFVKERFF